MDSILLLLFQYLLIWGVCACACACVCVCVCACVCVCVTRFEYFSYFVQKGFVPIHALKFKSSFQFLWAPRSKARVI